MKELSMKKKKSYKKPETESTETESTETKTTGRPPGSKNKERAEIEHMPAKCPKCGGVEFKIERTNVSEQKYNGKFNGRPYQAIHRKRARCSCGQYLLLRFYV